MSVLLLLLAMISIQLGAAIAKGLFPIFGPLPTTMMRLLLSCLMLLAVWRPWRVRLSRAQWKLIARYGMILGAMNALFYLALARIPLGVAVTVEFIGPLAVAVFGSRKLMSYVWAALALAGLLLLAPRGTDAQSLDPIGLWLAAAAGACWGLYIVFGHRAGREIPAGLVTTWGMVFAAAVVLPFGLATAQVNLFSWHFVPYFLGVAFFSGALPYSLEMTAMKQLPAALFGILMSLEPAVAALSGALMLGEKLRAHEWVAVVIVMSASAGSVFTSRRSVAPEVS